MQQSSNQEWLEKLLEEGNQAAYEEELSRRRRQGKKPRGLRQLEERQAEYDALEDLLDSMDT